MTSVDRAPSALSRWLAAGAALLSAVATGYYSTLGLVLATLGLVLLAMGLSRGTHRPLTIGCFGLFAGAVVAGAQGAPVLPVLAAVVFAVLAWDVGGYGIDVGQQLGRAARTRRIEALHAAGSAAVGGFVVLACYGVYRLGSGGQPVAALFFLLVAGIFLFRSLR